MKPKGGSLDSHTCKPGMFLATTRKPRLTALFLSATTLQRPHHSSPYVPAHFIALLDRCLTLPQLKQIQAPLTTSGLHTNPFLIGKLISILTVKLQNHDQQTLPYALLVFAHSTLPPNLFTWNTLVRAFSHCPTPHHALHLFAKMHQRDTYSYAFALKACARLQAHETTRAIHGLVAVAGCQCSNHAVNTLMHAYASCGNVTAMKKLFDVMPSCDIVAWNVMLGGYVQNSFPSDAVKLFQTMSSASIVPTDVSIIAVLSACSQMKEIHLGRQIHGYISKRRMQFEKEINLSTSLVDMYVKCARLEPAEQVFREMKVRDVGAWNALLGGYVHNGCFMKALQLFERLQESGLSPDCPTLVITLNACGNAGMLDAGKSIHASMEARFHSLDAVLGTALIEMYSKCGCIEGACQVFDKMAHRDAMAWSSMIRCLAVHGRNGDALNLFDAMRQSGVRPDAVTFVAVLHACSHAGLVEEGLSYFKWMRKVFNIAPRVEHFGCMIDLLSRGGRLREALELVNSMEGEANAIIWRSLLSACRANLDVEVAETAVENLSKLQSEHCGDYVLLSNIYAAKGMWDEARRVRKEMKESNIRKNHAFSFIESVDQIAT